MKSILIRLKQEAQELPTLSQSPWGTHMLRVVPILPGLPTTVRSEGHWPGLASGLCWEELEEKWFPHTAVGATEPKGDAKLKAHWCGGAKAAKAKKGMWVCCHPRRGSQAILGSQRRNEIRGSEIQGAGVGATVAVGPGRLVWLCEWPVSKFQAEVHGWAPSLTQWNANCIRYLAGGLIFPPLYQMFLSPFLCMSLLTETGDSSLIAGVLVWSQTMMQSYFSRKIPCPLFTWQPWEVSSQISDVRKHN